MQNRKQDQPKSPEPPEPAPEPAMDAPAEIERRKRRKAAGSLLGPAIAPVGAGAVFEADARLDDRSETQEAIERASRTPD